MTRAEPSPGATTIFALSSGAPPAGIAVVRISGPSAGDALATLAGTLPPPRRASLRSLRAGDGVLIDRALVLWFPGPATATGEDLAELHLHGGRAVIAAVLAALAALPGLIPAEPGGFTRRAFANGRIDLAEAEGLADLLAAETETQRRQALRLAEGGLSRLIAGWRARLLDIAAEVEAAIDHEDEGDVPPLDPALPARIATVADEIAAALAHPPAERLRDGLRIVLAGPVNSGKSSLFNALIGRSGAIVSALPGTTRDLIEAPIVLDGLPCILIDSAGLREADDVVERIGIDRAREAIESADLILWLGEPDDCALGADVLRVHARADLPGRAVLPEGADVGVSATTGHGIARLAELIGARLAARIPAEATVALNQRHRAALQQSVEDLRTARTIDPLLVAEHLRLALSGFDRVSGRHAIEDMLDTLFTRFCVGK